MLFCSFCGSLLIQDDAIENDNNELIYTYHCKNCNIEYELLDYPSNDDYYLINPLILNSGNIKYFKLSNE